MKIRVTRVQHQNNPTHRIVLNNRTITYSLVRRNRKTFGLRINASGLTISAPLRIPQREIEAILQRKADWIIEKLDAWENSSSNHLEWRLHAVYWLLGEPYQLIALSAQLQLVPQNSIKPDMVRPCSAESTSTQFSAQQLEHFVLAWYQQQATACMTDRLAFYAEKLGVGMPVFHLSNARSRWGSCNASGVIRLNWRLIQLPLALIDYVIAHELAHLFEMNHSQAFWEVVAKIYPEYRRAQRELKQIGKLMI